MLSITAAGGVVYKKEKEAIQVLLIYRNGVWDLPKGKREPGESITMCARREVAEEAGIPLPGIGHFLTETYHEYQQEGKSYGKTTHWYSMRAAEPLHFTPQKEEGIEAVEWIALDKACLQVGYDNLREVLDVFQKVEK